MEIRVELRSHGAHLWTRELARRIRSDLAAALEKLQPGDVLVLDADGVDVWDYSFANELFGKTILSLPKDHPGRFVVIENLTAYTEENLTKALEGLNLAMLSRKGASITLLGKVHPTDRTTLNALLKRRGPATSSALAELFSLNPTAMNERLAKLTSMGLVRRERTTSVAGREQYEYRVLS